MYQFRFHPRKAVQAAAFLLRSHGGEMDKYLLIKMLYLADRASLEKWCESITGDQPVSMKYGPVLSTIYDLTKGDRSDLQENWEPFISKPIEDTNQISLKADPGIMDLSRAELAILQKVYNEFKDYDFRRIKWYTHNLPEYEDVGDLSRPIPAERILKAVGKSRMKSNSLKLCLGNWTL